MKTIMLVFGTRPEAIKMVPLVKEFKKNESDFHTVICLTGQHREMLDQVMSLFNIAADFDLNIMSPGQDLYDTTTKVLLGMREVLRQVHPDVVFVHGDTTTSMAAALAAYYQQIPVAHVEAGLRTHNIYSPWPEEINRQITGRIAAYHFAPTPLSRENLLAEGVAESAIVVTGNTVIDTLHMVVKRFKDEPALVQEAEQSVIAAGLDPAVLRNGKRKVLITGHRRENFGIGFMHICEAIKNLGKKYPEVDFIYPMHLNPNVRKPIEQTFGDASRQDGNIHFIEPLEYLSFIYLMNMSTLVLTDSGGIQEEAPGIGKPVLVMRDTTERPEALQAGTVKLVGTDMEVIEREVSKLLDDPGYYRQMSHATNPYGVGDSSYRIVESTKVFLR